ncbi:MAG: COX15/CtaA family protein [Saprospiraceae bacterium]|nr:COX15/CtaA family protein [Saprospiraceae bacterium]
MWLIIGFIMLLVQILLGGITRLTGSGLSITRWDIVTGILYPLSEEAWNVHFDLYKKTPQYEKINAVFSLSDFKFIFFWEYAHRLWARLMGLVFFFPFCWFFYKKRLDKILIKRLFVLILLTSFVASLGWIMVSSGLINRPWVNAYKLAFHLMAAVITVAYLLYIICKREMFIRVKIFEKHIRNFFIFILGCLSLQIFLGGVVAGMRASIVAPSWPLLQGKWIPNQVFEGSAYVEYVFGEYENSAIGPIIVQFWHRSMAYLLVVLILVFVIWVYKIVGKDIGKVCMTLVMLLSLQILLGIFTVLNSVGSIPLWLAVLHQLFGIVLFLYCLFVYWTRLSKSNNA